MAARLAVQSVLLLLAMLVSLEVVVYVITQRTLVASLETTLSARANQADPTACLTFRLSCGKSAPFGPDGGPQRSPGKEPRAPSGQEVSPPGGFAPVLGPSEATAAFIDSHLQVIHADGASGGVLFSRKDASQTLHTGQILCCSVATYKDQRYLVYTAPMGSNGAIVGVVQTSISEHQFERTMQSLRQALLIVLILGVLISGCISGLLSYRSLRPVRVSMRRQLDFVADAAHELRTPLAIQRTVGEVGMSDSSVDELQVTVSQMLEENQHLTRLVEDLSLLARADTNAVEIDRGSVDLSSLVDDLVVELQYLAEEREVTLKTNVQANIFVQGDSLRLRQLLLILLDNALKATLPGGTISVRLSTQSTRVRLEVGDTGPGIKSADLSHVFDRFYRSDGSRTGAGTGLGLSIAKWIVEAHNGQVHVTNASPHGAVFTVILPTIRQDVSAQTASL